MNLIKLDRS